MRNQQGLEPDAPGTPTRFRTTGWDLDSVSEATSPGVSPDRDGLTLATAPEHALALALVAFARGQPYAASEES